MIALACSMVSPDPKDDRALDCLDCRRRVAGDGVRNTQHRRHELRARVDFVDHAQSVRLFGAERLPGHQHLHRLSRWKQARQKNRRAATGRQPNDRFRLAERRIVGCDDEVRADGDLAATTVCHAIDGSDDRPAELTYRVDEPIKNLPLAQPLFLRHLLALEQVAADRECAIPGSRENYHSNRDSSSDRLAALRSSPPPALS